MVVVRGGSVTWIDSWLCQSKLLCLLPPKAIPAQLWIHPSHGIRALANSLPPPPKLIISSCHAGGERNPISPPETTELTTSLRQAPLKSSPLSPRTALPRQADKEPLCRELCPAQQLSQAGRGTGGSGGSCGGFQLQSTALTLTQGTTNLPSHLHVTPHASVPSTFSAGRTEKVWPTKRKTPGNPFPATLLLRPSPLPGLAWGSQLIPGGFCCDHELGQLETELAFPVRH